MNGTTQNWLADEIKNSKPIAFRRTARRRDAVSARTTDLADRGAELNDASGSAACPAPHPDQSAAVALSPLRRLVRTATPAEWHGALSADAVLVGAGVNRRHRRVYPGDFAYAGNAVPS